MSEKLDLDGRYPAVDAPGKYARWTGEKRCPLKGEWYLSGAIIEAYRAPNDLSTPYYIAKLESDGDDDQ